MTGDIVARANAALTAVTCGPWEIDERYPIIWLGDFTPGFRIDSHDKAEENARFVVESRTLVPEMVAEIEALRATVASRPRTRFARMRRPPPDCCSVSQGGV